MWNSINKIWQTVFEQCWEAFINGSLPIGAVITGENSEIISIGRNHCFDKSILNPKIAHAEMDALHKLNISKYPNVKAYTLYTSMECCPMCMGAVVMANLRKLKIAARDGHAGAAHLVEKDPYMKSKNMQIDFELDILEKVSIVMLTYFMLKLCKGEISREAENVGKNNPDAIQIAKSFYDERRLNWHISNKTPFDEIFNEITTYR